MNMVKKLGMILFAATSLFGCVVEDSTRVTRTDSGRTQSVSYNTFYDELSPYGEWVSYPSVGYVWHPRVEAGWRPYTNGHWVYSDYGWTWVSDYRWGWAPFHYGRWIEDDRYGWVWIPDTVWGPAWVSWCEVDGYYGWAPLPPAARWGYSGISEARYGYRNEHWVFVQNVYITNVNVTNYVLPVRQNAMLVPRASGITRIENRNGHAFNIGPHVDAVEATTRTRIPRVVVSDGQKSDPASVSGQTVKIYRPAVIDRTTEEPHTYQNKVDGNVPTAKPSPAMNPSHEQIRQDPPDVRPAIAPQPVPTPPLQKPMQNNPDLAPKPLPVPPPQKAPQQKPRLQRQPKPQPPARKPDAAPRVREPQPVKPQPEKPQPDKPRDAERKPEKEKSN